MHDKGKVKWTIQFSFKRSKSEETHFKINDRTYHVYLFLGALWSVWFDVWKGAPRQMPEDDVSSSYSKNFLICTHHSLVLWRRPPFQNWLLSWSSRLLNQGVRYFPDFPFLFECWVFQKGRKFKTREVWRALRNLRREQMTSQSCSHFRLQCNGGRRVVYSDSLFPGVFWPFARSFLHRLVSVLLNYTIWQSIGTFVCNLSVNNLFDAFFSG